MAGPGPVVAPVRHGKIMLLVMFVVIALSVAGGTLVYQLTNASGPGVALSPSTFSCSAGPNVTITGRLPASVKSGEQISTSFDGKVYDSAPVEQGFTRQSDGTWLNVSTIHVSGCGTAPGNTPGAHTIQYLDSNGHVLAQGSYTVTP